jgi:hypothetical protein
MRDRKIVGGRFILKHPCFIQLVSMYALYGGTANPPILVGRLNFDREAVCPARGIGGAIPPRQVHRRGGCRLDPSETRRLAAKPSPGLRSCPAAGRAALR